MQLDRSRKGLRAVLILTMILAIALLPVAAPAKGPAAPHPPGAQKVHGTNSAVPDTTAPHPDPGCGSDRGGGGGGRGGDGDPDDCDFWVPYFLHFFTGKILTGF